MTGEREAGIAVGTSGWVPTLVCLPVSTVARHRRLGLEAASTIFLRLFLWLGGDLDGGRGPKPLRPGCEKALVFASMGSYLEVSSKCDSTEFASGSVKQAEFSLQQETASRNEIACVRQLMLQSKI